MSTRVRVLNLDPTVHAQLRLLSMALLAIIWSALALPASAQTDGPPPARDYVSCGHFETQEGAQETLDSGDLNENGVASLDADGDGIACEDAFDDVDAEQTSVAPATSVTSLPKTGSGDIATGNSALVVLAGFAMISIAAALVVRRESRR